jgi:hypothetical protein
MREIGDMGRPLTVATGPARHFAIRPDLISPLRADHQTLAPNS